MKYFYEKAPEYHVIAAGSVLGVAANCSKFSFTIGEVDIKTMYPMDTRPIIGSPTGRRKLISSSNEKETSYRLK